VLRFVSSKIFLTRKASACGLRAICVSAEEGLGVAFMMFPKIATSSKNRS
jgi:hypothetical protein